jgi:uncharacterized repeat protein (TIGR02543 family)
LGGSVIQSQSINKGEMVTRPNQNPTREGYTFLNWYAEKEGYTQFNFYVPIEKDTTVYAKWQTKQVQNYTVQLFSNGGKFSNNTETKVETIKGGTTYTPEIPTKTNYKFLGWFTDNTTFNNVYNFESTPINTNLSVYAKWLDASVPAKKITISFDANGGSGLNESSRTVTVGEKYGTLPTVVAPVDTSFSGWYTTTSGGSLVTSNTMVTNENDHTLYAKFYSTKGGETSPEAAVNRFQKYLDEATYELFFPYRKGMSPWDAAGSEDFYSYEALMTAISMMANLKIRVIRNKNDLGDIGKVYVTDKSTGIEKNVFTSVGFDSTSSALFEEIVDYGSFLGDGDENTQKKELASFLANLSHESTGGGFAATTREWGLFFNEESGLNDDTVGWYTTDPREPNQVISHENFLPNPAKSYHGRGPIQLSWNYNYGLFSAIFYGDKQVLLDDPNAVCRAGNGYLAFASAIWFWMTPQGLKPSCHSVMTGVYTPTADDIAAGRTTETLGIAWSIVIINGYYEANKDRNYGSVGDRILFYEFFTGNAWHENGFIPGVTTTGIDADISGDKLDTLGMTAYAW